MAATSASRPAQRSLRLLRRGESTLCATLAAVRALRTLSHAAMLRVKDKQAVEAQQTVTALISAGRKPNVFLMTKLVNATAALNREAGVREALMVLRAEDIPFTARMCGDVMSMLLRLGREDEMHRFFDKQLQRGLQPDAELYRLLLHSYAQKGDAVSAQRVFEELVARKIQPSARIFCSLIYAFDRARDTDGARAAFVSMLRDMAMRAEEISPFCVSALLSAFLHAGEHERLESFFANLPNLHVSPNTVVYSVVLRSRVLRGDADAARRLFSSMRATPGARPNDVSYNTMMQLFRRLGSLDEARALLQTMREDGVRGSAAIYNTLLGVYARCGKYDAMLALFGAMKRPPPPFLSTPSARAGLSGAAVGGGAAASEEQRALVRDFLDGRGGAGAVVRTVRTYNAVIGECASARRFEDAYRVMMEMVRDGVRPDAFTYAVAVHKAASFGDAGWTRTFSDEARRRGVQMNAVVRSSLLVARARAGELDGAVRQLLAERSPTERTVYSIVKQLIAADRLRDAEQLYRTLRRRLAPLVDAPGMNHDKASAQGDESRNGEEIERCDAVSVLAGDGGGKDVPTAPRHSVAILLRFALEHLRRQNIGRAEAHLNRVLRALEAPTLPPSPKIVAVESVVRRKALPPIASHMLVVLHCHRGRFRDALRELRAATARGVPLWPELYFELDALVSCAPSAALQGALRHQLSRLTPAPPSSARRARRLSASAERSGPLSELVERSALEARAGIAAEQRASLLPTSRKQRRKPAEIEDRNANLKSLQYFEDVGKVTAPGNVDAVHSITGGASSPPAAENRAIAALVTAAQQSEQRNEAVDVKLEKTNDSSAVDVLDAARAHKHARRAWLERRDRLSQLEELSFASPMLTWASHRSAPPRPRARRTEKQ